MDALPAKAAAAASAAAAACQDAGGSPSMRAVAAAEAAAAIMIAQEASPDEVADATFAACQRAGGSPADCSHAMAGARALALQARGASSRQEGGAAPPTPPLRGLAAPASLFVDEDGETYYTAAQSKAQDNTPEGAAFGDPAGGGREEGIERLSPYTTGMGSGEEIFETTRGRERASTEVFGDTTDVIQADVDKLRHKVRQLEGALAQRERIAKEMEARAWPRTRKGRGAMGRWGAARRNHLCSRERGNRAAPNRAAPRLW